MKELLNMEEDKILIIAKDLYFFRASIPEDIELLQDKAVQLSVISMVNKITKYLKFDLKI